MSKKIIFVSHLSSPTQLTGAEKSLLSLMKLFSARGYSALLTAPRSGIITDEAKDAGIPVLTFKYPSLWIAHGGFAAPWTVFLRIFNFVFSVRAFFRFRKFLKKEKPAIVFVNSIVNVLPSIAAKSRGVSVVWLIREIVPPGWRRRILKFFLSRFADYIVCVSHAVKNSLDMPSDKKITVIHTGIKIIPTTSDEIEAVREEWQIEEDNLVFAWAGQFEAHKGLEHIFPIMKKLKEKGTKPCCFVLGAPKKKKALDRLKKKAVAEGLEYQLMWAGFQSRPEFFLGASDILLFTTVSDEPFPRVVLEAMATGCPVIAYEGGGVGEIVIDGETGFLAERGNWEQMAQLAEVLFKDKALRDKMSRQAHERILKNFTAEKMIDAYEKIVAEILREDRA